MAICMSLSSSPHTQPIESPSSRIFTAFEFYYDSEYKLQIECRFPFGQFIKFVIHSEFVLFIVLLSLSPSPPPHNLFSLSLGGGSWPKRKRRDGTSNEFKYPSVPFLLVSLVLNNWLTGYQISKRRGRATSHVSDSSPASSASSSSRYTVSFTAPCWSTSIGAFPKLNSKH